MQILGWNALKDASDKASRQRMRVAVRRLSLDHAWIDNMAIGRTPGFALGDEVLFLSAITSSHVLTIFGAA
jgi:hypothetical protein